MIGVSSAAGLFCRWAGSDCHARFLPANQHDMIALQEAASRRDEHERLVHGYQHLVIEERPLRYGNNSVFRKAR